jgi:hypothetical protein
MNVSIPENKFREDFRPEECDGDKGDLKMAAIAAIIVAILAAIFKMVAKTPKNRVKQVRLT